jgi:spore germination cell wall hydrolase CwlJ-like protein
MNNYTYSYGRQQARRRIRKRQLFKVLATAFTLFVSVNLAGATEFDSALDEPPPWSTYSMPDAVYSERYNHKAVLEPQTPFERVLDVAKIPKGKFADSMDRLIYRLQNRKNRIELTEREKECLSRNIYHEAANEPVEGQVAVAIVTLNRANDPFYPNNVCDVVYQRGSYSAKKTIEIKVGKGKKKRTEEKQITKNWTVCQFSWTCERVKAPSESDPRYVKIKELVDEFSNGGYPEYREKYAKSYHYHAYYVNPRWKLNRLHRVGAHIFYD